jgi:hypothetical protein
VTFAPRLDVLPPAQRALWPELLAVPRRYGTSFNPLVAQKALAYFEGGDLGTLAEGVRRRLTGEAARDLQVVPLALRSTRLD